jgi:GNAT superfamily N-acetyltransferase|tara:strand:+ start:166 stop:627 length:462 start_codon:yes stop_codon:yes gene_type:complete
MIKYQQEFLSQVQSDIEPLINLHWKEIALNQDNIKLNPDWEAYANLEAEGKLQIFTAREGDLLVGYFVVTLGYNIHYKDHLCASNDVIYMHKDYRKGFAGIRLIKFAEKVLREDGVSTLTINTKIHQPFDKVLERLKFKPIERVYSKYLKGDT